jgi:hypothetical protein
MLPPFSSETIRRQHHGLSLSAGACSADTFAVSNTQDSGDRFVARGVLAANSHAGPDDITFTAVTGVITLTTSLPTITDDVTIIGPGAANLTVSGGGAIQIVQRSQAGKTVSISGCTFANGKATNYANGARDRESRHADGERLRFLEQPNHWRMGRRDFQ